MNTPPDQHFAATATGRVCSFHARALRHHLEALPGAQLASIVSCALTNLSPASYTQLKTLARTPLSDRIAMLLIRLRDLAAREGRDLREIALTHGDVASLVATDRVSATRALHRLESDGLIELGYRSIGLTGLLEARADLKADTVTEFHVPCAG